jgi:hypothetical protein
MSKMTSYDVRIVLATSLTAFRTLFLWVKWHPMTWRALCISPYHMVLDPSKGGGGPMAPPRCGAHTLLCCAVSGERHMLVQSGR